MNKTIAREEYVTICNNIFELLMSGVSENASAIIDLQKAAETLEEEYGF